MKNSVDVRQRDLQRETVYDVHAIALTRWGFLEYFNGVIKKYTGLVTKCAYEVTHDQHAALDIAQQTFLKAYQKLDTLREPHKFRNWLCSIAYRLSLDHLRKEKRHHIPSLEVLLKGMEGDVPDTKPYEAYDADFREVHQRIADEIKTLSATDRAVLAGRMVGQSHKQIAAYSGITPVQSATRTTILRKTLREQLTYAKPNGNGKGNGHA